jgi:hypothetical protein
MKSEEREAVPQWQRQKSEEDDEASTFYVYQVVRGEALIRL